MRKDDGEICTLENMGPSWIHINREQMENMESKKQKFSNKGKNGKKYFEDGTLYRLFDIKENKIESDWMCLEDWKLFIEDYVYSASQNMRFITKNGYIIKRRYRVETKMNL